jgi:hypothetical protein
MPSKKVNLIWFTPRSLALFAARIRKDPFEIYYFLFVIPATALSGNLVLKHPAFAASAHKRWVQDHIPDRNIRG